MPDSVTSLHPMYPYSEHLPCRCGLFRRRGLRFIELHLWLNLSLIHLFISLNWYWARTACANEFLQIGAMRQTAQIKAHNSVKKPERHTTTPAYTTHSRVRNRSEFWQFSCKFDNYFFCVLGPSCTVSVSSCGSILFVFPVRNKEVKFGMFLADE